MFSAEEVKIGGGSKYQSAGISEQVTISEVKLIHNDTYNTDSIQLTTINEDKQEGLSKRLSLKTKPSEGKTIAAWTISASYLARVLIATGKTQEEAKAVITAPDVNTLVKQLTTALVGQTVRGLFSSREYEPNKFAIELYATEKVGGNKLYFDPSNKNHNSKLAVAESLDSAIAKGDLPF